MTSASERAAALSQAFDGARRALVITEGLLLYLSEPQIRDLADSFAKFDCVRSWIFDLASPAILEMMRKEMGDHLTKAPLSACFANPYKKFNPGGTKEPERLQAYTNMANVTESNGKKNGPDIHPTPLGYEVMAKVIRSACGE